VVPGSPRDDRTQSSHGEIGFAAARRLAAGLSHVEKIRAVTSRDFQYGTAVGQAGNLDFFFFFSFLWL